MNQPESNPEPQPALPAPIVLTDPPPPPQAAKPEPPQAAKPEPPQAAKPEPPQAAKPEPPRAAKPAPAAKVKSGAGLWPLLGVIAFLVLAAGEVYLWRLQQQDHHAAAAQFAASSSQPTESSINTGTQSQIADLQNQIAALQQNIAKAQPAPDSIGVQTDLAEKIAVLTAEVSALQTQFATDHATVVTLASNSAALGKLTGKIQSLDQLAAARMALDSGQPVGAIPNAPAALAAFATTPPPTMAELIMSYPQAARAADTASVEKGAKTSFWKQVAARLESLITVSDGDHVMIGAPAAAITAAAGEQLNAGDLAGAVNTLTSELSTGTQAAMATWLAQAKSLIAARAAIIQMSQS